MPEVPAPPFSAATSDALHARAVAFVVAFERGEPMPEPFDALACDLARHQRASGYDRLCAAVGLNLASLTRADAIPAIPTDAFKAMRIAAHPDALDGAVFRTSGTTVGARGAHALRHTATYDRGAVAFGRSALAPHLGERFPVLVLGPPPSELPDSSLTHMLAAFVRAFDGASSPESRFFLRGDTFELASLDEAIARACVQDTPVFLAGTSFAFVHLLDALGDDTLALPRGSLVMQTGGFKGRSRVVEADDLRRELARVFSVPERAIVAEYGMTELASQGWEAPLFSETGAHGTFVVPPWMRVQAADPDSLAPLSDGARGVARITDLLNVDSAVVVQTADLVTVNGSSVTLHGRAPGAAPRGCSLAIDELLAP
jgi:hypothetical protein